MNNLSVSSVSNYADISDSQYQQLTSFLCILGLTLILMQFLSEKSIVSTTFYIQKLDLSTQLPTQPNPLLTSSLLVTNDSTTCTDPIRDSQYPQLTSFTGSQPKLPSYWKCTAVLHPFSPLQSNSTPADQASPFFELCIASVSYAEGVGMNALLVGTSGRKWWYKITQTETLVSTDGVNYSPVDLGWEIPTTNWFGEKSNEAECSGTGYMNWMEAQKVDWWKIPVGTTKPPPATWMWFDNSTKFPVRLMFGQGPIKPTLGSPDQLALFQMFSFIHFPSFEPLSSNSLDETLVIPNIKGFTFGNPNNYQLFSWNTNLGMTAFMTPVNEEFNPLPTRVLYKWKSDSEYKVTSDRTQNTLMKYIYNPQNPFTAQKAVLTGRAPKGVPPPRNSGTGFLANYHSDTLTKTVAFSNFPFGQQPPAWVQIPEIEGKIHATLVNNPVLSPNQTVTIISALFPPSGDNYPNSTYLWAWYSPLNASGSSSRPITFMQSQSGVGVGTSLALADYFAYEEYKEPIDPCNFTPPPFISIMADKKWQTTGVKLTPDRQAKISYVGGFWTANPNDNRGSLYGASGNPTYINAKEGYTMPNKNEGALIGKVGDQIFFIGDGATTPVGASGTLSICINDDLEGVYGAGCTDNEGFINVEVTLNSED